MSYISASGLSFYLPNNTKLFSNLNFAFNKERIAVVGKNGVGKTTLFNLILKKLRSTSGTITVSGCCELLPQDFKFYENHNVLDILEVKEIYEAYINIVSGNYTENNYEILENRWNIEDEIRQSLERFGFNDINLYRAFNSFSGGEKVKLLLSRILISKPDFLLMDEPTNNLDQETKDYIYNFISNWENGIIVISHDRSLLELVDHTYELSPKGLKHYMGNYTFYINQRELEKNKVLQDVNTAKLQLKKAKELREKSLKKHAKRVKEGKSKIGSIPKIVANSRKASSEATLGVLKRDTYKKIESARQKHLNLLNKIESDLKIRVEPSGDVKHRNRILIKADSINYKYNKKCLWGKDLTFNVMGQDKILLTGRNGSGKSTLCKLMSGELTPLKGEISINMNKISILDQDLNIINNDISVLDNMKLYADPNLPEYKLRIILGGFLFYNEDVFKHAGVLSGGEKMRLAMACVLSSSSSELLILDEPTNNMDLDSIEQFTRGIKSYKGAFILVSHDRHFIDDIGFNKVINLL